MIETADTRPAFWNQHVSGDNIALPLRPKGMDLSAVLTLEFIGILIAIVIGTLVYRRIQADHRTNTLPLVASKLGFEFRGTDRKSIPWNPDFHTALFSRGDSPQFSNILTGTQAGLKVAIFDYRYTTGSGRSRRTWKQTVAAFSQELWLPEFELRRENLLDRVGEHFVHTNIDFDSHPDFSHRFLLSGPSENLIRKLFSPSLIRFLQKLSDDERWHIEGSSTTLIVYPQDELIPPDTDTYHRFLDKTSSIAQEFFRSPEALSEPVR